MSNFYHSAKKERGFPLTAEEFGDLFAQLESKFRLKQARFYDAVKNYAVEPEAYSRQQKFHEQLKKLPFNIVIRTTKLRYLANVTKEQLKRAAQEVGIAESQHDLLWPLLGSLNLVRLTKEKGIDVKLVVDAVEIARRREADWVILLSGDADFVPAIELIKNFNIKTLNLHTYHGSASELRRACGKDALITFDGVKPSINWYD